jgi:hypothetical protein
LRLNLDETAVCLFQGGGRGNIFVEKGTRACQNVSRDKTRKNITHIAFICDDPAIQRVLPQVLVANEHTFLVRDTAALLGGLPPNVTLLRRRSAWNNKKLCAQVIRMLRVALAPFTAEYQPILVLDAAPCHIAPCVWSACAAAGIWAVLVPAKATWLLQPLDTHAFLAYKVRLQGAYQDARLLTADGEMNLPELVPCVCRAVREVLEARAWARAFDHDGFSAAQTAVSERVSNELGHAAHLDIPSTRPSLDQVKLCFPKRAKIPWTAIWRPFDGAAAKAAAAAKAGAAAEVDAVAKAGAVTVGPTVGAPFGGGGAPPLGVRRSARIALHLSAGAPHPPLPPPPAPRPPGASSSSSAPALAASSSTTVPIVAKPASSALGAMTKVAPPKPPPPAAAPMGVLTRSRSRGVSGV